jgi:hypothetical protein
MPVLGGGRRWRTYGRLLEHAGGFVEYPSSAESLAVAVFEKADEVEDISIPAELRRR